MKVDHQLELADEVWTDGWLNEWTWNDRRTKMDGIAKMSEGKTEFKKVPCTV